MHGEILQSRIAARKQQLFRDHQTARRKQDQSAQFGHPVDREPAEEVDGQRAIIVQGNESAERKSLIGRQHHCRDAGRHAQAERHDADERIVTEQHVGEYAEQFDRPRPRGEDFLVVEIIARARRSAPAGKPGRHQRREPGFVLHGEHESRCSANNQAERGDEDVPTGGAHRGRQLVPEECAQSLDRARSRPVDGQKCSQRKAFQVKEEIAVERDRTRNRQRGKRGAVEDRQPLQLVERQRAHAAPLDAADQPFELAPTRPVVLCGIHCS